MEPHAPSSDMRAALRTHAQECERCTTEPLPMAALAAALEHGIPAVDAEALSQRALLRLRPELARRAAGAWWRQVAAAVLLALLPLPLVLLYDAYLLQLLYEAMRVLVPASVALCVVGSYAAGLVLLFAGTYAAIPILLGRGGRWPRALPG